MRVRPVTRLRVAFSPVLGGPIEYAWHLPEGADPHRVPVLYLLHGRGQSMRVWQRVVPALEELAAAGMPLLTIMPDAPWQGRASFWLDSRYTGGAGGGPGAPVETAIVTDLVDAVDATFGTLTDRRWRLVGGVSMGGAGALRMALVRQDRFAGALALSPAVYVPLPAAGSSTRVSGAYGVGDVLFDDERYREVSYVRALARLDPALPVRLFIAAGDRERIYAHETGEQNITLAAAGIHDRARRVPGVTSELRILPGGHSWAVWVPAFREGVRRLVTGLRDDDGAA